MEHERIETKEEVETYLSKLNYALDHNATLVFQRIRRVDENRNEKHTNRYTIASLFPNENPEVALKRELRKLTVEEYLETVKDTRFSNKSEMRVFCKVYNHFEQVYIKIRTQLMTVIGNSVFVMSFHYAKRNIEKEKFLYHK